MNTLFWWRERLMWMTDPCHSQTQTPCGSAQSPKLVGEQEKIQSRTAKMIQVLLTQRFLSTGLVGWAGGQRLMWHSWTHPAAVTALLQAWEWQRYLQSLLSTTTSRALPTTAFSLFFHLKAKPEWAFWAEKLHCIPIPFQTLSTIYSLIDLTRKMASFPYPDGLWACDGNWRDPYRSFTPF